MDIKLQQNVGVKRVNGEKITVKHPVDRVFLDGRLIGYIDRRDNAIFAPLQRLHPDEIAPIMRAITKIRTDAGEFTAPKGIGKPPVDPDVAAEFFAEREADEEDGDDDDE